MPCARSPKNQETALVALAWIELSIHSLILDFGSAPTFVAVTWPPEKIISVGTPRTPYFVGTFGFWSMSILAIVTLSLSSPASSSSAGAIIRQGPHHSAQKSTTTGFCAFSTSLWNEASETLMGADMNGLSNCGGTSRM